MSGFICREVTFYPPLSRYTTSYTPHREDDTVPIIVIEENHAKVEVESLFVCHYHLLLLNHNKPYSQDIAYQ